MRPEPWGQLSEKPGVSSSEIGQQSIESMAKHLQISKVRIHEMVDFLIRIGLLAKSGNQLKMNTAHVHLGADSLLVEQHHKNWRICALTHLAKEKSKGIRYSGAVSLSRADVARIKESLMQNLQNNLLAI